MEALVVDSRAGSGNIQDEPKAFCSFRKQRCAQKTK